MKHAFLLVTHFSPERTYQQVQRMKGENFLFYIHFDKKLYISPDDPYYKILKETEGVHIYENRINVQWGAFGITKINLKLMQEALKDKDVKYIHPISGECLHVKSVQYINDYFRKHAGQEFIRHWIMPHENTSGWGYNRLDKYHLHDYFNPRSQKLKDRTIKQINAMLRVSQRLLKRIGIFRRYPSDFPTLYGGSAWWSITRECALYVMDYLEKNPEYYRRFKFTQLSDEMFLQTIIVNSPFKENVVNNNLRYIVFLTASPSHPQYLTMDDLDELSEEDVLFARKFTNKSTELIDYLEKNVYKDTKSSFR